LKNEWFYISRFKARREEWHIVFKASHDKTIFKLLEDEDGNIIESDYACLDSMIKELLLLEPDTEYKIVHKKDLASFR